MFSENLCELWCFCHLAAVVGACQSLSCLCCEKIYPTNLMHTSFQIGMGSAPKMFSSWMDHSVFLCSEPWWQSFVHVKGLPCMTLSESVHSLLPTNDSIHVHLVFVHCLASESIVLVKTMGDALILCKMWFEDVTVNCGFARSISVTCRNCDV